MGFILRFPKRRAAGQSGPELGNHLIQGPHTWE
jgi:hypothetical protein